MADRVIYAYVVGDLLHVGHLRALEQAKALGTYLIVGVLTDNAVRAYKRDPIIPFEERIELIENLRCVDIALPQEDVDPTENLRALDVDVVVHGNDWDDDFPGAAYMRGIGKEAIRTQYFDGQSTTKIIEGIYERFQGNS